LALDLFPTVLLPAVDRTLVEPGGLGRGSGAGRILGSPGAQSQRGAIGVAFAAGGNTDITEHTVASFVDLNATSAVGVQAVQLGNDGLTTFVQAALDVVDRVASDVPGASDGFRDGGAIGLFVRAAPQFVRDGGVAGTAAEVVVALLEQRQIVDALTVVDATDCLSFGARTVSFAVVERVRTVKHRADVVRLAVQLALWAGGRTLRRTTRGGDSGGGATRDRGSRSAAVLGEDGANANQKDQSELEGHFLLCFCVSK